MNVSHPNASPVTFFVGPGSRATTVAGGVVPSQQQRHDIVKDTTHNSRETASDWGFLEFAPFSLLQPMHYADEDMNVVIMSVFA